MSLVKENSWGGGNTGIEAKFVPYLGIWLYIGELAESSLALKSQCPEIYLKNARFGWPTDKSSKRWLL